MGEEGGGGREDKLGRRTPGTPALPCQHCPRETGSTNGFPFFFFFTVPRSQAWRLCFTRRHGGQTQSQGNSVLFLFSSMPCMCTPRLQLGKRFPLLYTVTLRTYIRTAVHKSRDPFCFLYSFHKRSHLLFPFCLSISLGNNAVVNCLIKEREGETKKSSGLCYSAYDIFLHVPPVSLRVVVWPDVYPRKRRDQHHVTKQHRDGAGAVGNSPSPSPSPPISYLTWEGG